jgi:ACR3 family arsenite transporter
VPIWWGGIENKLTRLSNLNVWQIPADQAQALAALAQRSMQWQVTVQDGSIWVSPRPELLMATNVDGRLLVRIGADGAPSDITDALDWVVDIDWADLELAFRDAGSESHLDTVTGDRKLLVSSLVLNWVLGPALMFALAWLFLPDLPEYRTGLIIVGLARCIAMVIIWNDLACGEREAAAVLVALNSVFQVVMFAVLGWFYLSVLPGWLGLQQASISASPWQIAKSVLIFLGIPLLAGYLSRRLGEKAKGRQWYESKFLPVIGPWALYGLLFTIVILFALQGDQITNRPWDFARIALPLLAYFAIMWGGGFLLGAVLGLGYARTTTLAFTAAGNNFELAIAVAIATYGATSGQALAGVVGPLIEVPVLVGLVYVSLALRQRFHSER